MALEERFGSPSPLDSRLTPEAAQPAGGQSLERRLGGESIDALRAQIAAGLGQKQPSNIDALLNPQNLIMLGLAAAGGLSGNKDLQATGLGMASGVFEAVPQLVAQGKQEHFQRIEQLTNQLEKKQEQVVRLLTSQPGLFVDEQGENYISPERMGQLLGTDIPVNPAAMLGRIRSSKTKDSMGDMAMEYIKLGMTHKNPLWTQMGTNMLNEVYGWNLSPQSVVAMSTGDITSQVKEMFDNFEASSVVAALNYSMETGLPIYSVPVRNMLTLKPEEGDDALKRIQAQITADGYAYLKDYEKWLQGTSTLPDGTEVSNLELHRNNNMEALEIWGKDKPVALTLVKDQFEPMRQGDKYDELQFNALMTAVGQSNRLQILLGQAWLPGATEEDRAKAMTDIANGIFNGAQQVTGLKRIEAGYQDALIFGPKIRTFVTNKGYKLPPGVTDETLGMQTTQIAMQIATDNGTLWSELDFRQKNALMQEAANIVADLITEEWEDKPVEE